MEFTDENIHGIIASGDPVVVDFWASYCGPCRAMAPTIDALAKEYEGRVVIGKYNCDEESDFCTECGIRSLPTLLFFKNGERTDIRLVGGQKEDAIKEKLEQLLAL
ncbi:MAG: thioredoxin [Muribaculaceae bacterium]|nr:thioredoxin [Muribaculaceae bacterium]